jgi:hypothetical protein
MRRRGALWTDEQLEDVVRRLLAGERRETVAPDYNIKAGTLWSLLRRRFPARYDLFRALDRRRWTRLATPKRPKPPSKRVPISGEEEIRVLSLLKSGVSASETARRLNTTRDRVRTVLKRHGLKLASGRPKPRPDAGVGVVSAARMVAKILQNRPILSSHREELEEIALEAWFCGPEEEAGRRMANAVYRKAAAAGWFERKTVTWPVDSTGRLIESPGFRASPRRNGENRDFSAIDAQLPRLYETEGVLALARRFKEPVAVIRRRLHALGVTLRTAAEGMEHYWAKKRGLGDAAQEALGVPSQEPVLERTVDFEPRIFGDEGLARLHRPGGRPHVDSVAADSVFDDEVSSDRRQRRVGA